MNFIPLLILVAASALAVGQEKQPQVKIDPTVFIVKVVANREDGLAVRKFVSEFKHVRDPVSGKIFKQLVGQKLSEAIYFIRHTEATKSAPISATIPMRGKEVGTYRMNEISVLPVIVPTSIGKITPPKE